jgi:hypothetical protein
VCNCVFLHTCPLCSWVDDSCRRQPAPPLYAIHNCTLPWRTRASQGAHRCIQAAFEVSAYYHYAISFPLRLQQRCCCNCLTQGLQPPLPLILFAGLENLSHMPPAVGPDKRSTSTVRISSNLKHRSVHLHGSCTATEQIMPTSPCCSSNLITAAATESQ